VLWNLLLTAVCLAGCKAGVLGGSMGSSALLFKGSMATECVVHVEGRGAGVVATGWYGMVCII